MIQYRNNLDHVINRPKNLDQAIKIAETIGNDFDFIRVDLYLVNDLIYFGELTNTPGSGVEKITPYSMDLYLGSKIPFKPYK
jgi:hypothetical protein